MATRDLSLARAAFASGDPRLSRAAHGHPKAKLGSASPGAAVAGCEPGHDSYVAATVFADGLCSHADTVDGVPQD